MVGRRKVADSRGEFFGSAAGIGDGASAWDFQPAAVRLAQGVSRMSAWRHCRIPPAVIVPEQPEKVTGLGCRRIEIVSVNGRRVIVDCDVDVESLLRVMRGLETLS